jgi:hypothetical protein
MPDENCPFKASLAVRFRISGKTRPSGKLTLLAGEGLAWALLESVNVSNDWRILTLVKGRAIGLCLAP